MSTALRPRRQADCKKATQGNWTSLAADERYVLWGVSWKTYETLLKDIGDRPIRMTYDGSNLEFMSPSRWHEIVKLLLGRFVFALAYELDIPLASGGSMTFKREDLVRGLEPDECFWIANEARIRCKREIDVKKDPPPDLAIEIDIWSSSLDRQSIYAKLRVPEIWRFDGQSLHILLLKAGGKYVEGRRSKAFPFLPVPELVRFLPADESAEETACVRRFLSWVRTQGFRP